MADQDYEASGSLGTEPAQKDERKDKNQSQKERQKNREIWESRSDRENERSLRQNQRNTNYAIVLLTTLTMLVSVWQSHLTRASIATANQQAKASEEANELTRRNMALGAMQAKQVAEDSRIQTERAANQNTAALNLSIEAMRLDQRPWVGIKSVDLKDYEDGKMPVIAYDVSNTGKTTALDFECYTFTDVKQPTERRLNQRIKHDFRFSGGLFPFYPGESRHIELPLEAELDANVLSELDKTSFYFAGECRYADIFAKRHVAEFCYTLVPKIHDFVVCDHFNKAS